MARRKSAFEDLFESLCRCPWWVSIVVAGGGFLFFRYILPGISFESPITNGMMKGVSNIAPIICLVLLIPAPISLFNTLRKKKLFDKQIGIESVRSLSWREFEELSGEVFRRQGHQVTENHDAGPDGGVDLVLKKDGKTFLVQCKHWKSYKVDVKVVREMFGIMAAKNADGVYIITSGRFTQEARNFANGKPIKLMEGNELSSLIKEIQNEKVPTGPEKLQFEPAREYVSKLLCSKCGAEMVRRKATRGPHAGKEFWGCSKYPKCNHIEPMK